MMRLWKSQRRIAVDPSSNDLDLVSRLHRGDPAAMESIVADYWTPLVLYAARLLQDDLDDARDVSQEALVRLWNHRAEIQPGAIKAYLFSVGRNLALDELRKREVRRRPRGGTAAYDRETPATPLDLMEQGDLERAVAEAINDLPLRRREVFTLAYLHRLPYRTIAQVMGISPATVKNQMAAALADLREALGPYLASRRAPR